MNGWRYREMSQEIGFVGVYSEDLSCYDLQLAISENHGDIMFSICDEETKREFTTVEWVTFILMAIPATESVVNIVTAIKEAIITRLSNHMKRANIKKSVIVKVKIKLPFFSYEKDEEIIVGPVEQG